MATFNIFILCLVLLVETTSLDRKRVGGTKSARGGRSRSTSTGVRNYHNVDLSGRIVTGSSPFTSSTWRSAAIMGSIYGGRAFVLKYPYERKLPPICTNNKEKSPEGRAYGYFICPRDIEPDDYKYCCGAENREYCCNKTMAQIFYSEHRKSSGASIGVIIGMVVAVIIAIVLAAYCCRKRKHTEDVIHKFSKSDERKPQRMPLRPLGILQPQFGTGKHLQKNSHQAVVPKRSAESFDGKGVAPPVPPPPYNAATTSALSGYDDAAAAAVGSPYGTPQAQPPAPHQFDGEKSGKQAPGESARSLSSTSQQTGTSHPPCDDISFPPSVKTQYQPSADVLYSVSCSAPHPSSCDTLHSPSIDNPYSSTKDPFLLSDNAPYPPLKDFIHSPSTDNPFSTSNGDPRSPLGGDSCSTSASAPFQPICSNSHSPLTIDPYPLSSGGNPFPPFGSNPYSPDPCLFSSDTSHSFSSNANTYRPMNGIPQSHSADNPFLPSTYDQHQLRNGTTYLSSHGPAFSLPYSRSGPPYLSSTPAALPYSEM